MFFFSLFLLIGFLTFFLIRPVLSQGICQGEEECREVIRKTEEKLRELSQQKNTLSSQIQYMNTQITLTELKIQQTQRKISSTEKEIEGLDEKIVNLDRSIDYLAKLLLKRLVVGYKNRGFTLLEMVFDSSNIPFFVNRYKYWKATQEENQRLLIKTQSSKLNLEEQKRLREEKIAELQFLHKQLDQQKIDLASQKAAKEKLFIDTQNSELIYQQMLAQAQRQLSAFKSFVKSSGANTVIPANGLGVGQDGLYLSQRDERWANQRIGYSDETVLNVGCLITSVAMSLKKRGVETTPSEIASNPDYFWANTAYMLYRWNISLPGGPRGYKISNSQVDEELGSGNYVIVGINYGPCGEPEHYVVLTKKEGGSYKMHDPLYGPDLDFYSKYNTICWAEVIK